MKGNDCRSISVVFGGRFGQAGISRLGASLRPITTGIAGKFVREQMLFPLPLFLCKTQLLRIYNRIEEGHLLVKPRLRWILSKTCTRKQLRFEKEDEEDDGWSHSEGMGGGNCQHPIRA